MGYWFVSFFVFCARFSFRIFAVCDHPRLDTDTPSAGSRCRSNVLSRWVGGKGGVEGLFLKVGLLGRAPLHAKGAACSPVISRKERGVSTSGPGAVHVYLRRRVFQKKGTRSALYRRSFSGRCAR